MMTARVPKVFVATALGLALMSAIGMASAKVVRWDLQNVTFQDDGKATGFFLYDADAPPTPVSSGGQILSTDITLESLNPSWPWRTADSFSASNEGTFLFYDFSFSDFMGRGSLLMYLSFDTPLTDAGGTIGLDTHNSAVTFTYFGDTRHATGGRIVAIPEPSEALLLALGLAALVGFSARWRKR